MLKGACGVSGLDLGEVTSKYDEYALGSSESLEGIFENYVEI